MVNCHDWSGFFIEKLGTLFASNELHVVVTPSIVLLTEVDGGNSVAPSAFIFVPVTVYSHPV